MAEWIEASCAQPDGERMGEPFVLTDEQLRFLLWFYRVDPDVGSFAYPRGGQIVRPQKWGKGPFSASIICAEADGPVLFDGWDAAGEPVGKPWATPWIQVTAVSEDQPLALETPVPTPAGWSTVADLNVGDFVLDGCGNPAEVRRATDVLLGLECYRVRFDDGSEIVASERHGWTLERLNGHGDRFETVTVTTRELAETVRDFRGRKRYRVESPAWNLPDLELPVDPYLLGLWLGDGATADATIAFDGQDRTELEAIVGELLEPHEIAVWSESAFRIRKRAGLCPWGHDSTVDVARNGAGRTTCGPCRRGERGAGARLLTFRERLRSAGVLGEKHVPPVYLRAGLEQRRALLQGLMDSDGHVTGKGLAHFCNTNERLVDNVTELLTTLGYKWRKCRSAAAWRVFFTPGDGNPPARLSRKSAAARAWSKRSTSRRRYVESVDPVPSVPVRCIGIDTVDHLFLAGPRGIPTRNTDNVWRSLQPMIELGDVAAEIPDTGLTRVNLPGGGRIEPVTSSARSRLGQRVTFCVQDEALALDTPVPTPAGWSTIGELAEGDEVFDADGSPCVVVGTTEVQHGRPCYRVTFSDRTSLVASDGHLWLTRPCTAARPRIRTTGEMVADGRRFRVPARKPFDLPNVELPVDPYLLGYWLGDGSTGQPNITVDDGDADHLCSELGKLGLPARRLKTSPDKATRISFSSAAGYQATGRPEMVKRLQTLECWRAKRIPRTYFRASFGQREALMQGLMDSDGHVTTTGQCTFVGNGRLAADFAELARTLGQYVSPVFRADHRAREGGTWKVNFAVRGDLRPFRLPRKAERVRPSRRGPDWVTVAGIELVDTVPVRCIKVNSPDSLFVAGDGCAVTHNSHSWVERNGGIRLADNQRRNLAGMSGRFLETTNAWDPAEQSVAQRTSESPRGVYIDHPSTPVGSVRNKRERRKVLKHVYGDAYWIDLDRIDFEIEALLDHDPAQAERFFLNRVHAGESIAFDLTEWKRLADPHHVVNDHALIVLGVDGARFDDALAIIATEVKTGFQWPVGIWERPEHAGDDYEHDFVAVDGAVTEAFERWSVWRAYCDPQRIESLVDRWKGKHGDRVVVEWFTNRPRQVAYSVRNFRTAISAGDMTHDGDETFTKHVGNARRGKLNVRDEDGRPMWTIQKDRPMSPAKMDAAMAAVISWEARGDAIAADAQSVQQFYVPFKIR